MAIVDIPTLKSYFEAGDQPSRQEFEDLIDTLNAGTSGAVIGPPSSVDRAIAVFDDTTGQSIVDALAIIDLAGNITAQGNIEAEELISNALATLASALVQGTLQVNDKATISTGNTPSNEILTLGSNEANASFKVGSGEPEGSVTGNAGEIYVRVDGATSNLYQFKGTDGTTIGWEGIGENPNLTDYLKNDGLNWPMQVACHFLENVGFGETTDTGTWVPQSPDFIQNRHGKFTSFQHALAKSFYDVIGHGFKSIVPATSSFTVVDTDDASTTVRRGLVINQTTGSKLVLGTGDLFTDSTYSMRYEEGSITPVKTLVWDGTDNYTGWDIARDELSGRTYVLLVDNGYNNFRIRYSDDNGASWQTGATVAAEALYFHVSLESRVIVICQAGNDFISYVSEDNGDTFTAGTPYLLADGILLGSLGENSGTSEVYAGTLGDGLLVSDDGGFSWTQKVSDAGIHETAIHSFVELFEGGQQVFYASGIKSGVGSQIIRSLDAGVTWDLVFSGTAFAKMEAIVGVDNGNLYAFEEYFSGTYTTEVYKSTDFGNTWESITTHTDGKRFGGAVQYHKTRDLWVTFGDNSGDLPTLETIDTENDIATGDGIPIKIILKAGVVAFQIADGKYLENERVAFDATVLGVSRKYLQALTANDSATLPSAVPRGSIFRYSGDNNYLYVKELDGVTYPLYQRSSSSLVNFSYLAEATSQTPPPLDSYIMWNNPAQLSSTEVYVSNVDADGVVVGDLIEFYLFQNDKFLITDAADISNRQVWDITDWEQVGSYYKIEVSLDSASTGSNVFTQDQPINFSFIVGGDGGGLSDVDSLKKDGTNWPVLNPVHFQTAVGFGVQPLSAMEDSSGEYIQNRMGAYSTERHALTSALNDVRNHGFYKAEGAGTSWVNSLVGTADDNWRVDIVQNPESGYIIAGYYDTNLGISKVKFSQDGGTSWAESSIRTSTSGERIRRIVVSPANGYVYALVGNHEGDGNGPAVYVYESQDGGLSWGLIYDYNSSPVAPPTSAVYACTLGVATNGRVVLVMKHPAVEGGVDVFCRNLGGSWYRLTDDTSLPIEDNTIMAPCLTGDLFATPFNGDDVVVIGTSDGRTQYWNIDGNSLHGSPDFGSISPVFPIQVVDRSVEGENTVWYAASKDRGDTVEARFNKKTNYNGTWDFTTIIGAGDTEVHDIIAGVDESIYVNMSVGTGSELYRSLDRGATFELVLASTDFIASIGYEDSIGVAWANREDLALSTAPNIARLDVRGDVALSAGVPIKESFNNGLYSLQIARDKFSVGQQVDFHAPELQISKSNFKILMDGETWITPEDADAGAMFRNANDSGNIYVKGINGVVYQLGSVTLSPNVIKQDDYETLFFGSTALISKNAGYNYERWGNVVKHYEQADGNGWIDGISCYLHSAGDWRFLETGKDAQRIEYTGTDIKYYISTNIAPTAGDIITWSEYLSIVADPLTGNGTLTVDTIVVNSGGGGGSDLDPLIVKSADEENLTYFQGGDIPVTYNPTYDYEAFGKFNVMYEVASNEGKVWEAHNCYLDNTSDWKYITGTAASYTFKTNTGQTWFTNSNTPVAGNSITWQTNFSISDTIVVVGPDLRVDTLTGTGNEIVYAASTGQFARSTIDISEVLTDSSSTITDIQSDIAQNTSDIQDNANDIANLQIDTLSPNMTKNGLADGVKMGGADWAWGPPATRAIDAEGGGYITFPSYGPITSIGGNAYYNGTNLIRKADGLHASITTDASDGSLIFRASGFGVAGSSIDLNDIPFQVDINGLVQASSMELIGNIGLGTELFPNSGTLSASVNLGVGASLFGSVNDPFVYISQNLYYDNGWKYKETDFASYMIMANGWLAYRTGPLGSADDSFVQVEHFRAHQSGNFSIGNTNDLYKLDVSGSGRYSGDLIVNGSDGVFIGGGLSSNFGKLRLAGVVGNHTIEADASGLRIKVSDSNVNIYYESTNDHVWKADDSEIMRLSSSGNLLLNTVDDSYGFHCNGTARIVERLTASSQMTVNGTPYSWGGVLDASIDIGNVSSIFAHNSDKSLYLGDNLYYDGVSWRFKQDGFASMINISGDDGTIKFRGSGGTGLAGESFIMLEKLRFNMDTGNLSIGNTNNIYKLDVSGDIRSTGVVTSLTKRISAHQPYSFGSSSILNIDDDFDHHLATCSSGSATAINFNWTLPWAQYNGRTFTVAIYNNTGTSRTIRFYDFNTQAAVGSFLIIQSTVVQNVPFTSIDVISFSKIVVTITVMNGQAYVNA